MPRSRGRAGLGDGPDGTIPRRDDRWACGSDRTRAAGGGQRSAIVGCSGGRHRAPRRPDVEPTIALGTLATGTAPRTSAAPDSTSVAPAIASDDGSDASSFAPAALVAGDGTRPWLLAGTSRERPGEPAQLAVLTSPDGAAWTTLDVDAPAGSSAAAAALAPDGTAVIAGTVDGDDGPHPALWTLDGDALGDREDLAVDGVVRAMALDAAGSPVLLLDGPDGPAVAVRALSSWDATTLPDAVDPAGIAVRADAVVVTGPTTFRSSDGGMTFEPVATAPLGPVVASGGGFAAADCTTGGVAISGDGSAWTALAAVHPSGEVPVAGECGTIDVDDEGGAWLAATVGGQPVVYRVLDGSCRPSRRAGAPAGDDLRRAAPRRRRGRHGGRRARAAGRRGGVQRVGGRADHRPRARRRDDRDDGRAGRPPGPGRRRAVRRPRRGRRRAHVALRRRRSRRLLHVDDPRRGGAARRVGPPRARRARRADRRRRQPRWDRHHASR